MQHDLFKNFTENEKSKIREWIQIQTNFDFKYNEKNVNSKEKKVLVKNLINDSNDFLENLSLKLFQSEYFVKCLIEQKSKKLKGEYIARYISKELLENTTFLESVISLYPQLIESIGSAQKKNTRIWELALQADGDLIQYLPKECFETKFINLAVSSSPRAIRFIPADLINSDLCLKAIEKNAKSYLEIPETFQHNFDFCKIACNRNLNVWDFLKKPIKFDKFILEFCLSKSGIEGIYHANKLQDDESFLKLLFATGNKQRQKMILAYMKDEVIEKFALKALQENKDALKIFKLCSEVGKDHVFKKIESDLPKIRP